MTSQYLAELVELSESRAYASLVATGASDVRRVGASAIPVGSALALRAPDVTNTLVLNRVIGLGVVDDASEEVLDRIEAIYAEHGLSYAVEVSPIARPSPLPEWLRARRIRRTTSAAMLYRRTEPLHYEATPRSVIVEVAGDPSAVAGICGTVFSVPDYVRSLIAATAGVAGWRQWIASVDEQPVGAALSYVHGRTAWLGWDAVLPAARGRGVQTALIGRRVADAHAAGCEFVTAETAVISSSRQDPSFRNYSRLGFSVAYDRATYVAARHLRASRSPQS